MARKEIFADLALLKLAIKITYILVIKIQMNHQRHRKKVVKHYESKKLRKKLKKKQNRGSETQSEAHYQSVTAFWVTSIP